MNYKSRFIYSSYRSAIQEKQYAEFLMILEVHLFALEIMINKSQKLLKSREKQF